MSRNPHIWTHERQVVENHLKSGGTVFADYVFAANSEQAAIDFAEKIACGQTVGFVPEKGEEELFVATAKVTQFFSPTPGYWQATLGFPGFLAGNDLAGLLTVMFGKISFAPGIQLTSLSADETFFQQLRGCRVGLKGLRQLTGVAHGPLLMAILKPGLGISDTALAQQFGALETAGVHLVKDDEVRIDRSIEDSLRRLAAVQKHSQGNALYVMHLSGPAEELRQRARRLQAEGAKALLFCPYTYGLALLQSLCADDELKIPVFVHPAFTGVMTAGPSCLAAAVALGTLMRWAGADGVLYPSPYGSIALPFAAAQALHHELIRPMKHMNAVASVPSAGITPKHVAEILRDFGSDVVINAGTGIVKGAAKDMGKAAEAFLTAMAGT